MKLTFSYMLDGYFKEETVRTTGIAKQLVKDMKSQYGRALDFAELRGEGGELIYSYYQGGIRKKL